MYFIGDVIYVVLFYVLGYRKEVVRQNLLIAFPEKTEKERLRIAKDFYHNLVDTILEMIKLISISDKQVAKRFSSNIEVVNQFYDTGVNLQLISGHFFNWEIINLGIAKYGKYPFVGVYMPVANKAFTKIVYDLRSRYNTILIPATEFKTKFHKYVNGRYALGLAADQNPGSPDNSYWINFFGKLTPFVKGPEKGAKKNNTPVIFGHFYKVKRGYYRIDFEVLATEPQKYADGQLTRLYVEAVEKAIQKTPANYLWSHRRWKYNYSHDKHCHIGV
jgi:KDO2-lipid IV(A) lauroyltransferase